MALHFFENIKLIAFGRGFQGDAHRPPVEVASRLVELMGGFQGRLVYIEEFSDKLNLMLLRIMLF